MKTNKIFKKEITSISDFKVFLNEVEQESVSFFDLERRILEKQFPKIVTRKEGYKKLEEKLPMVIKINKNKTYNNGRIELQFLN